MKQRDDFPVIDYCRHLVLIGKTTREAAKICGLSKSAAGRWTIGMSHDAMKEPNPSVEYRGIIYFLEKNTGYFRSKSRLSAGYLHRAVYLNEVGPIPEGHDIHHIDENKANNLKENLVPKSKHWHQRDHMAARRAA